MAEQPESQCCEKCRFFLDHTSEQYAYQDEYTRNNSNIQGFCRRYPPTVVQLNERMGTAVGVVKDYWCGEYQSANPETVTEAAMAISRQLMIGDVSAAQGVFDKFQEDQANR